MSEFEFDDDFDDEEALIGDFQFKKSEALEDLNNHDLAKYLIKHSQPEEMLACLQKQSKSPAARAALVELQEFVGGDENDDEVEEDDFEIEEVEKKSSPKKRRSKKKKKKKKKTTQTTSDEINEYLEVKKKRSKERSKKKGKPCKPNAEKEADPNYECNPETGRWRKVKKRPDKKKKKSPKRLRSSKKKSPKKLDFSEVSKEVKEYKNLLKAIKNQTPGDGVYGLLEDKLNELADIIDAAVGSGASDQLSKFGKVVIKSKIYGIEDISPPGASMYPNLSNVKRDFTIGFGSKRSKRKRKTKRSKRKIKYGPTYTVFGKFNKKFNKVW
jgi:hypothetical protein